MYREIIETLEDMLKADVSLRLPDKMRGQFTEIWRELYEKNKGNLFLAVDDFYENERKSWLWDVDKKVEARQKKSKKVA